MTRRRRTVDDAPVAEVTVETESISGVQARDVQERIDEIRREMNVVGDVPNRPAILAGYERELSELLKK